MNPFDFVNRANADYIERLQQTYRTDPDSLDPQWRAFFAGFDLGLARQAAGDGSAPLNPLPQQPQGAMAVDIADLVHSYRELGHFEADLDPMGHHRPPHPLLQLSEFGLSPADLDREVGADGFPGKTDGTLRDLIDKLRLTYCRTIGVEYMGISDKTQRDWLQQRMEPIVNRPTLTAEQSHALLADLVAAQGFEEFLHTRYIGQKRFSLEGAESLIPLLNVVIEDGAALGVEELVLGMAHRGRLNVLAHVLRKPAEVILAEFEGTHVPQSDEGDGDVKYHLGYSNERISRAGHKVHVALSFNPSHLELVDPVVCGVVRAKQNYRGDHEHRTRVVPILIHGDAAFTGQGIVHETLGLSELPYYRTGGTIHVIINNQIGFTTLPRQGRFTPYPTDVAKMIQAPIFHVNGDDPEAVIHAARLAISFRQEFHCDVMIDLWCYRKHGHNEADEPSYTQPLMYKTIAAKQPVAEHYVKGLIERGKVTAEQHEQLKTEVRQRLDSAQKVARESRPRQHIQTLGGIWRGMTRAGADWSAKTAVAPDVLRKVGDGLRNLPAGFSVHPKLTRLVQNRLEMTEGRRPIDWGGAEMLALGSLVLEGTPIRFTGQDAQRGTFSHRHAALRDYNTGEKYVPLASLSPDQAPIIIVNTMLSELAVLGFEYGFATADPRNLVLWEAQFGDFVNGAQPIIDQYLAAAESKWQKMCGLVLLLPHGYEGQGPEHSNAYLERFLQLCAEDNMQVCYPSLPSQYFHVLRRQMKRTFRKPLVLMMPKAILREEEYASSIEEFTSGSFQNVIDDPRAPARERVRRLLLCSGKIYFTLDAARRKQQVESVAIVRVEQLYPFPQKEIQAMLARYNQAQEISWVQEEPRNRGAWTFMSDRLEPLLPETAVLTYCGRDEAASPATGAFRLHQIEEQELVAHALELPAEKTEAAPPATPREVAAPTSGQQAVRSSQ